MKINKCDECGKVIKEYRQKVNISVGWDSKEICLVCAKKIFSKTGWNKFVQPGVYEDSDLVKKIKNRFEDMKKKRKQV